MTVYYNEIDPFAAEWLRQLIRAGQIAPGDVDERSIEDVKPDDLKNYAQCHFFAGIGVWSYALRQIGWSDDQRIWTGSCPCQPFSTAGKGNGFDDERHLWFASNPGDKRVLRYRNPRRISQSGQRGSLGPMDLRAIIANPLNKGSRYSQPILLSGRNGVAATFLEIALSIES